MNEDRAQPTEFPGKDFKPKTSLMDRFNTAKNNTFTYINGKIEYARAIPFVGPIIELTSDLLSYDPQGPGNTGQKDLLLRKGLITPILKLPFKAVVDTVDLLKEFHILVANPSKLIFSKHQKIESIKSIVKVIISIPSIIVHFAIMLAITTLKQSKTLINRVGILLHNLTNLGLIDANGDDGEITIDNRLTMPLVYMKATYNPLVFLFNVVSFAINTAIVMPINLLGYFVNLLPIVPRSKATHSENSLNHQRKIDFTYTNNAGVGLDLHTGDKILNDSKLYALNNIKPESGFFIEKLNGLFKPMTAYALSTPVEKKAEKRESIVNFIKPLIRNFTLTVAAVFAPVTLAYRILENQPEWNEKHSSIGGMKGAILTFAAPLTGLPLLYSLAVRTGKIFSDVPARHVDSELKTNWEKFKNGSGKFIHAMRHISDNFLSKALPLYNNGDSHGQLPSESKVIKSDKASFWKQSAGRNTELTDPLMDENNRVENQGQKDFQPSI